MSIQDKPAGSAGIDAHIYPAAARALGEATGTVVNGRSRTAADIAAQLERDAKSLGLTGGNLPDEESFFERVSATAREAAAWLRNWEPLLEKLQESHKEAQQRAVETAYSDCAGIASEIRDVVANGVTRADGQAWRAGTDAVCRAIIASAPIAARCA